MTNPIRFPGQYQDAESGLYQNYFRDYDPVLGAYTNHDPYGVLVTGVNRYQYVGGNPVTITDSTGEVAPVVVWLAYAGFVLALDMYTGGPFTQCASALSNGGCWSNAVDSCTNAIIEGVLAWGVGKAVQIGYGVVSPLIRPYLSRVPNLVKPLIERMRGLRGPVEVPQKLLPSPRDYLLSRVTNPRVRNAVNELYKRGAKMGNGSSMDAYRIDGSHLEKIIGRRKQLTNILKEEKLLNAADRQIVDELLLDIDNALAGR